MRWRWALLLSLLLPGAGLFSAICGNGSQVLLNGNADKVLFLTGSADPAPPGSESGGFNDSAWTPAIDFPGAWPGQQVGVPWSAHDSSGLSDGDDALLVRRSFSLPLSATAITAILELAVDDNAIVWFNGVTIQADAPTFLSGNTLRSFTVTAAVQAGLNVLALRIHSPQPTAIGYTFRLTIQYDLECPTPTVTPSDSPSPTVTPSVTPTFTPSPTFTVSSTFTVSPTITPTSTVTNTFTPSPTFSASPTPSVTPTAFLQTDFFELRAIYPNPFSDHATLYFGITQDAEIEFTVFNVAGEPVAQRRWIGLGGAHTVQFNGRNDADAPLASGVYLLHAKARGKNGALADVWERLAIVR